jgi:hypothetical protein
VIWNITVHRASPQAIANTAIRAGTTKEIIIPVNCQAGVRITISVIVDPVVLTITTIRMETVMVMTMVRIVMTQMIRTATDNRAEETDSGNHCL